MSVQTERRVIEIVAEHLGLESDDVTLDSSFIDDLGADTLDMVELYLALADEFDMEIPDEDTEKLQTVREAVEYLNQKIQ